MTTVYMISGGEYSDYYVERIFERREDADAYIEAINAGAAGFRRLQVEEAEFHPAGDRPTVYTVYHAQIAPSRQTAIYSWSEQTTTEPEHRPTSHPEPGGVFLSASGPDRERVMKSVADRLAQWKAEQEQIA